MNAELHINFTEPADKLPLDWGKFVMRAYYEDAGGYLRQARYTPADIPPGHAPAMQAVTAVIVALGEPWTATSVVARLAQQWVEPDLPTDGNTQSEPYLAEWLELTVEATGDTGGTRQFASRHYPALAVRDAAAVAFFKYFTTNQK